MHGRLNGGRQCVASVAADRSSVTEDDVDVEEISDGTPFRLVLGSGLSRASFLTVLFHHLSDQKM